MSYGIRNDRGELIFATKGRDVVYVGHGGIQYAAKIVHVWDKATGTVNVVQFGDGVNMREPTAMRMSVEFDDGATRANTWHFADDVAETEAFTQALKSIPAPLALQTFTSS